MVTAILLVIAVAGCTSSGLTAPPAPTATEGPPTATPRPTATTTPEEISPMPEELAVLGGENFFRGNSTDCRLPCWYGLRPGLSTYEDFSEVMHSVFSIPSTYDLRTYIKSWVFYEDVDMPGIYDAVALWVDEEKYFYEIRGFFNEDNDVLEMLVLSYMGSTSNSEIHFMYPGLYLTKLGLPSYWVFGDPDRIMGDYGRINTTFFYKSGIFTNVVSFVPVFFDDNGTPQSFEYCLRYEGNQDTLFLVPEYPESPDEMTAMQSFALELNGMTLNGLADGVLADENYFDILNLDECQIILIFNQDDA